jgi:hypothetical protein
MSNDVKPTEGTSSDSGIPAGWLAALGSDTAKTTLGLYLIGTITSVVYYSRFSVLTLDLIKAQAILVGCYVIALYLAVPITTLWLLRDVSRKWLVVSVFFVALSQLNTKRMQ